MGFFLQSACDTKEREGVLREGGCVLREGFAQREREGEMRDERAEVERARAEADPALLPLSLSLHRWVNERERRTPRAPSAHQLHLNECFVCVCRSVGRLHSQ